MPGSAQGDQHGTTIGAGQHSVEHDRVVIFSGPHKQAVLAVVGAIDGMPVLAQALGDECTGVGVVLDDQDAH